MLMFIALGRLSVQNLCWRKIFDLVFFVLSFNASKSRAAHCKEDEGTIIYVGK